MNNAAYPQCLLCMENSYFSIPIALTGALDFHFFCLHQICYLLSSTFGILTETAYEVWYKENHSLILEKPLILLQVPLTMTDKTEVHPARMFSPVNQDSGFCSKYGPTNASKEKKNKAHNAKP